MPFGFKAVLFRFVSFRAVSCRSIDAESNCVRKVGGEWQIVAMLQLEVLKTIAVFEASVQPHDTSPSREYLLSMLERNRTKRNGTKRFS